MLILDEVAAGVLVDLLGVAGQQLLGRYRRKGRGRQPDVDAGVFLAAYGLGVRQPLSLDLPPGLGEEAVAGFLRSRAVRSILQELLALQFAGGPSECLDELQENFVRAADVQLSGGSTAERARVAGDIFAYFQKQAAQPVAQVRGDGTDPADRYELGRTNAVLAAIPRHAAAIAAQDPAADRAFLDRYRRHVIDHHGKLQPPDLQRRRRVPLADIFVVPRIVEAPNVRELTGNETPVEVEFDWLAAEIDRTVLLGDAGGGKTTSGNAIMYQHATSGAGLVPFLVTLREFAAADPPARSVVGHVEHRLETFYNCAPPVGIVERLLLDGAAVVIFDGLDELLDAGRRADVAATVEQFAIQFPLAPMLVTSRLVGYDEARLDETQFETYRMFGFDDARVGEYVRKWFAHEDNVTPAEAETFTVDLLAASEAVADLRSNPLMLALLCILYRGRGSLPRNRPEIYEQCSSLFLRHWDAYRRIHQDLRARDLVEPALRHLAYWIFTRPRAGTAVTERELVARTSVFLLERGFEQRAEADAAAAEFIQFCRGRAWVFTEAGVNSRGEALYAFTHRTFLEYFAAAHLAAVSDTPQRLTRRLAPRVARQQWDVVAELAVQIKDRTADRGAERIYTALLHDADGSEDERENTRAFLARCCAFAAPPPRILRELTQQAVTYAIRPNPHGSGRLAPLGWLLHSHLDGSHIIKDELTAAVDEQLKADDQDTRRQALALVVFAADVIWMVAGHEKRIGSSWDDFGTDNRVRYAQQMAEHAPDHPGFAVESFLQQAVSLRQVLDWHGPGVRPLVSSAKQISYRLGPNNEIAYLALPIAATFMGLPTGYHYRHPWRAWLLEQLHDFGDTLESLGDPPWSDSEDHDYRKYFAGVTDRIGLGPLTGTALAAAGVLLLTCAERDKHPDFIDLFSRVDHLEPFLPYLQARRDRSGSLPPLNVGHGHTRLFQDWARHQVDFTLPNRGDLEREAALPSSENNAR